MKLQELLLFSIAVIGFPITSIYYSLIHMMKENFNKKITFFKCLDFFYYLANYIINNYNYICFGKIFLLR